MLDYVHSWPKKLVHQEGVVKTKRNYAYCESTMRYDRAGKGIVATVRRQFCNTLAGEADDCLVDKMAPGSRCMSGNTCGCGMSWTYR
ncbi:hypothetical protein TNCV_2001371 [Trichonephila clavipes]|nr:hypothetical protein TNCV_2001371 [Trichonephila clavipes]